MATKRISMVEEADPVPDLRVGVEPLNTASRILPLKLDNTITVNEEKNLKAELTANHAQNYSLKKNLKRLQRRRYREMKKSVFGYELIMDLSQCDLSVMSSKKKLAQYVDKLCKLIKMKKYGKVQLPYFGLQKPHTKGYSLLQFIETSSITGHFSEYWRKSYINIFSCKSYDHKLAAKFTKEFFGAKYAKARLIVR
jgi:S-adenosylmethionine/arginine decarboxylase-like enzyme